jgi:hypothetical protein
LVRHPEVRAERASKDAGRGAPEIGLPISEFSMFKSATADLIAVVFRGSTLRIEHLRMTGNC